MTAWNQTWHVPAAPNPLTGKESVALAAKEFGVAPKYRVLSRPMLRMEDGSCCCSTSNHNEMLHQSDSPYLVDSSKFAREFGLGDFYPYAEGIRTTAASFKRTGPL